ncbi:hypothetical protein OG21DRAFT_1498864 [Imleria badia]|nr:hypothetical protein OG21DRAFT_1498864 [Imleria badia]
MSKNVDDQWQQAYKTCLQYEARAKSCLDHIRSRALGYLIQEAPYDESRDWICQEINSCLGENAKLQDLADLFIGSFLQVFRPSWTRPSSPSFDTVKDSPEEDLEPTPRTTCIEQRQAYAPRCLSTGSCGTLHHIMVGNLEVAHILPRTMDNGVDTRKGQRNEEASVWTVMQRFGRIGPEELNGDHIHRLENVMTLWDGISSLFEGLQVWFEPSDDDSYTCFAKTSLPPNSVLGLRESFTMTTTDAHLPRPSPDYLRLHAAFARIANLSGAVGYVNSMSTDLDDPYVLENDRSPAMMALRNWGQYTKEYGQPE